MSRKAQQFKVNLSSPVVSRAARGRSLTACALLLFACCFLFFFFPLSPTSSAQEDGAEAEATAQPLNLHQWGAVTLFHGLPSDRVRAIAQDAEGMMWFGTDGGLARYDGRRTQTFVAAGLPPGRAQALRVDADGALWIGTSAGAARMAGGVFRAIAETEGKSITAILAPERGRAILASEQGVIFDCRAGEDGSINARTIPAEATPPDSRGAARESGAAARPAEARGAEASRSAAAPLTSLAIANGIIYAGSRGRGLLAIEGDALREVASRPRQLFIETLATGADGQLLVGTRAWDSSSGLYDARDVERPARLGAWVGTVSALSADARGGLWLGTDGRGAFRQREGNEFERFTFAGTAGGLRSDRIFAVFVDREGVVWFGTDRGVCRFDPRSPRVEMIHAERESNFVRALWRTADARLWAGTNRGLFVRGAGASAWLPVGDIARRAVYAINEDESGRLLIGTASGLFVSERPVAGHSAGELRFARLTVEGIRPARSSAARRSPDNARAENDRTTASGASARSDNAPQAGPAQGGDNSARAGSEGASASGESARQAEAESAAPPGAADDARAGEEEARPVIGDSVRDIARFQGALYIATYGRGVERVDGLTRRTLVWPAADSPDARMRAAVSLHADAQGRLLIGTADAGLFIFNGQQVTSEPALAPLAGSAIWDMDETGDGLLWLASARGLYLYRAGELQTVAAGMDARRVVVSGDRATSRAVWCATAGGGLLRVSLNEQFGTLTSVLDAEQGLLSQSAFALLPVRDEAAGGESLWIGTTRGLAHYAPGGVAPALRPARVMGQRAYQAEELPAGLQLDYPQNSLALDVAAVSSRTFPEQFQYAFLLYNQDGQIINRKLARDPQFLMERLAPGTYRVEARAFNHDLLPSAPLAFHFTVAPAPFPWTTAALAALLFLALVALWWGAWQNRRLQRTGRALAGANRDLTAARAQLAHEAETERRRIARDLHDQTLADLRHLILLTDQLPAAPAAQPQAVAESFGENHEARREGNGNGRRGSLDPQAFRAEIESISQEIRRICEDLSPSVLENVGLVAALEWALTDAVAHLPAEQRFKREFIAEEGLEDRLALAPDAKMQIYRIAQEAISNICRHSGARRVRFIASATADGALSLTLEDDGRGFDARAKKARKGRGLSNIRARAGLIDAEVKWRARAGGGTVFTLNKADALRKVADVEAGREAASDSPSRAGTLKD